MTTAFGKLLRERREATGLSVRGLARKLSMTHVNLSHVELGYHYLGRRHWAPLCKTLGNVTIEDLHGARAADTDRVWWCERLEALADLRERWVEEGGGSWDEITASRLRDWVYGRTIGS